MEAIIGWDVGGVHLKAARCENGRIVSVIQLASPLRTGLGRLAQAFEEAAARLGKADRHVVTMTGELADTFASRAEGVERLTGLVGEKLAGENVSLYAGRAGLVPPAAARAHLADIASANWHASAALVAKRYTSALFIDMGSTTTDIIPVRNGRIAARGYTDAERLAAGELVYTGLVRAFVMAVADRAPFAGTWTKLVNENFATMADVHRILGTLAEETDQMPTADGREKTVAASRARLARMVGRDAADGDDGAWRSLAQWLAEAQMRAVIDGAMLVTSAGGLAPQAPVVAAGIAKPVVSEIAHRLGQPCVTFETLLEVLPEARAAASRCAPAAALALLLALDSTSQTPRTDA